MRILQLCRPWGRACGIANFAGNLHAAFVGAGVEVETRRDAPADANFDVVLIQHEHCFYSPTEVRALLADTAGARRVVFAHSPGLADLDGLVEGFACMNAGMVDTRRPLHMDHHPAYTRPLDNRDLLKRRLGLEKFDVVLGTTGFVNPPRRFDRFAAQLAPLCEQNNWCLYFATALHWHTPQNSGLRQASERLQRVARRHPRMVRLERNFLHACEVNEILQACDLNWCWTEVPSKPYASGVASDLFGAGTRLLVADKQQHRAVFDLPGVTRGPQDFDDFLDRLSQLACDGDFSRHHGAALSWDVWAARFLSFLRSL
ncbi:MAG: hypothetical protein RIC55_13935 [Pirellulaceae bacterium]